MQASFHEVPLEDMGLVGSCSCPLPSLVPSRVSQFPVSPLQAHLLISLLFPLILPFDSFSLQELLRRSPCLFCMQPPLISVFLPTLKLTRFNCLLAFFEQKATCYPGHLTRQQPCFELNYRLVIEGIAVKSA